MYLAYNIGCSYVHLYQIILRIINAVIHQDSRYINQSNKT